MQEDYDLKDDVYKDETVLSIVVVGASGDLARKKIFPALFALYYQGLLPKHVQIVGYARSKTTTEEFREKMYSTLGCRIDAKCAPRHVHDPVHCAVQRSTFQQLAALRMILQQFLQVCGWSKPVCTCCNA